MPESDDGQKSLPELQNMLNELEARFRLHLGELAQAQHRLETLTARLARRDFRKETDESR